MTEDENTTSWQVTVDVNCPEVERCSLRAICQKIKPRIIGVIKTNSDYQGEKLIKQRKELVEQLIGRTNFGVCNETENPKTDEDVQLGWNPDSRTVYTKTD